MSKFNRKNMFKPGEVPVELKATIEKLISIVDKWTGTHADYMCLKLQGEEKEVFQNWVNSFIKDNAQHWVTDEHIDQNGLNVLCDWYSGRCCQFNYTDCKKLRMQFLKQALANIKAQEKTTKKPRAKKMSDTKLYKTLKAKVGAEYMRTTVTPALRKVWKQRDTIEDGADFDLWDLAGSFIWAFTEDNDLWINLNRIYFK
jgi:hypothetical protein